MPNEWRRPLGTVDEKREDMNSPLKAVGAEQRKEMKKMEKE
jgi:hypothetical protein